MVDTLLLFSLLLRPLVGGQFWYYEGLADYPTVVGRLESFRIKRTSENEAIVDLDGIDLYKNAVGVSFTTGDVVEISHKGLTTSICTAHIPSYPYLPLKRIMFRN